MASYRMIEVVGVSNKSYEDAIKIAIEDAKSCLENENQALDGEGWYQVLEQRARLVDGAVREFQIELNVSFNIKK